DDRVSRRASRKGGHSRYAPGSSCHRGSCGDIPKAARESDEGIMTLFPTPARTPLTPVPTPFGGKLPSYSSPLKKFVGRAVDCIGLPSRIGGVRTRWARTFRYYPARNLIIQIQG